MSVGATVSGGSESCATRSCVPKLSTSVIATSMPTSSSHVVCGILVVPDRLDLCLRRRADRGLIRVATLEIEGPSEREAEARLRVRHRLDVDGLGGCAGRKGGSDEHGDGEHEQADRGHGDSECVGAFGRYLAIGWLSKK